VHAGQCGHGVAVINSDYASSSVSLLGLDGRVLSENVVSSGSTQPGLTSSLSGDVVLPTQAGIHSELLIIDRYPAAVLSWVDVRTGTVSAQLSVATGFSSNPQDYLFLSATKAYVSRFESNPHPGKMDFDQGSDLLILDPSQRNITGNISMLPAMKGENPEFLPRPNRIVAHKTQAIVLLSGYAPDFQTSAESRLVVIDTETDSIVSVRILSGLHGCHGLALSPNGSELAISCSGSFHGTSQTNAQEAAIIRVQTDEKFTEIATYRAESFDHQALQFSLSYASDQWLVVGSFGQAGVQNKAAEPDHVYQIQLETGRIQPLLASQTNPFSLGDILCTPGCKLCFVADADRSQVHRFTVDDKLGLTWNSSTFPNPTIGLPPRYLSVF
jgi:hypothetical protein